MKGKIAITAMILVTAMSAQNPPKKTAEVSDSVKLAVALAERDILANGLELAKLREQANQLETKDNGDQKRLQDAITALYKAAGDPDKSKHDFNADTLELTEKPAPKLPDPKDIKK